MEPSSLDKIMEIDSHIACAVSGLTADAQSMVEHGRVQAQNHYFTYNEPMPAQALTQALCDLGANFGTGEEDSMSRPFGVALLVAGYDEDEGYQLYHTDPSGTFLKYKAKAIGSGSEGAQTTLQEEYKDDFTLEQAETLALSTLKAVMEEKVNTTNVDMACVGPKYKRYGNDEIKAIIDRL